MKIAWLLPVLLLAACGRESETKTSAIDEPERPPRPTRPERPLPASPGCDPGGTVCVGDDVVECRPDGTPGKVLSSCEGPCKRGACTQTCAVRDVELVYVVDSAGYLSKFDPRKLPDDPFRRVGKLACDPATRPFSMAVDRGGIAWVLYGDGRLYRVSIVDAQCSSAPVATAGAPALYGMGFVSDGPKATTETLFVAANRTFVLGRLATAQRPVRWTSIGKLVASRATNPPELTGTGDGKLFGYFPGPRGGFVQQLDPATAAPIGARLELAAKGSQVGGWAFAHWGGVFYVFVTLDGNSAVHAVDAKTGTYRLVREHLPHRIVGAGVSTCAPLLETPPSPR